jgi:demethylmenaquinone methyltransferase/2-methoxy-6-polyprenyl-1,4-benzoquinol methylase
MAAALSDDQDREAFVREVFETIAPVYDPMNRLLTLGQWERWQRRLLALAAPQPGERWLDVACGTADLSLMLAQAVGPAGAVEGVDLSPAMLAVGRAKVERAGLGDRIRLVEGDALDLPYPDESFDGAVVGFGLRNMTDVRRAVAEMRRVVRPGGRVLSLEVSHPEQPLVALGFHIYFDGIVPVLGLLAGKGWRPYAWLPKSLRTFPGRRALEAIFREAGLVEVSSVPLTLGAAAIHRGKRPL